MIVPCRVGVVNRRGMVPSRSSVRMVRATLAAPKNMKKIIMPARIWPVTLTSFSVLPACGERWLIWRPAETPPAWLNCSAAVPASLRGRRVARRVGAQGDGAGRGRAGAVEVGEHLPDHALDDGAADLAGRVLVELDLARRRRVAAVARRR